MCCCEAASIYHTMKGITIMKQFERAVALFSALVLVLSGCRGNPSASSSGSSENTPAAVQRDYMTLLYSQADTFNPYTAKTDVNRQLCRLLYEPLVKLDNNFVPHYSVASGSELDGKTCKVTLKNINFSDGSRVTADDVVHSFKLAKASSGEYAYKLSSVTSASASGSGTVVFTLQKADPYALNLLDFPILKKGSESRTDSDSVVLPPIGCGRYMLNEAGDGLVLNGKSFDTSAYSVKRINLINAPDAESVSHYVEVGAADMYYSDISDGNILRMSGKKVNINLNSLVFLAVNQNYGDLKLNQLRQAISSALDREAVCRDGFYNNALPATGFFNPVWEAVKSVQNIQTAADEQITVENLEEIGYNKLDSSGVRKNQNGTQLKFELMVNSENRLRVAVAQLIAAQLGNYGFKIQVVEKPYAEYNSKLAAGEFQLCLAEVAITPNMDISSLVTKGGAVAFGLPDEESSGDSSKKTDSSNNDTGSAGSSSGESSSSDTSSDTSADENITAAKTIAELVEGLYGGTNTAADLASVLQTEMPFIPVCYRTGVLFYNDNIENVSDSSVSDIYFSIGSYIINN